MGEQKGSEPLAGPLLLEKDDEVDGSTVQNVQASILWNARLLRTHPAFCGGLFEENSVAGNNIWLVCFGGLLVAMVTAKSCIHDPFCFRVSWWDSVDRK